MNEWQYKKEIKAQQYLGIICHIVAFGNLHSETAV
jgi:hypothetical protein